mmetsp:Transcript_20759/g.20504  ORF Transcript_20759/g.20504 Transcript_20759/m.20504 type:complete len:91 (-) Transcript_20759:3-275(-)
MLSHFEDYNEDYERFNERGAEKVAAFNYMWTDFLDEEELKELDKVPELPKPAEYLDMDKAYKMNLSKKELEALYQQLKDEEKEDEVKEDE